MKTLLVLATTLLLVACGGGGGTGDTGNTIPTSPTSPITATQIQFGNGTFGTAKFSQ